MKNSKKILSFILAVLLCVSVFAISTSADEDVIAYRFETANYDASLAGNDPTSVKASNDGSVRIKSDHIQNQYQMFFKVTDQKAMKEAIEETCNYYDGFLAIDVAVNQALTISGSACRPSISIDLVNKPHGTKIASTGENSLYSEQAGQFILDVSRYMEEEYNNDIGYVYLQVQCYNWGCGGGYGTQPDITFYPIKVFNGETTDEDLPTIATRAPDPNQTTFLNFSPKAKNDDQNDAETIQYSSDGIVWRSGALAKPENYGYLRLKQALKSREQVQTSFRFDQMGDAAADALNLARMGSNLMKLDITLEECTNDNNQPTIAEIGIGFNVEKGNQPAKPSVTHIRAWQYPGTTRTYYLDVSDVKHISQITNIVIFAQNYWYYRAGTREMFDWNVESGYAGKDAAEALGHEKCQIKPTLVISPISVYKGDPDAVANTDYSLVLNDFNQNGGIVPDVITLDDPNIYKDDSEESTTTTTTTTTTVATKPGETTLATIPTETENTTATGVATMPSNMDIPTLPSKTTVAIPTTTTTTTKAPTTVAPTTAGPTTVAPTTVAPTTAGPTTVAPTTVAPTTAVAKVKLKVPKFKLTSGKKQFKVKYTKVANATGFQVRYRIKGKWKIKTFTTKKNATKAIKKLKKGTYKVQVRAMLKKGKVKTYSAWSKAKKVKVK